jgi:hypothetical protein
LNSRIRSSACSRPAWLRKAGPGCAERGLPHRVGAAFFALALWCLLRARALVLAAV